MCSKRGVEKRMARSHTMSIVDSLAGLYVFKGVLKEMAGSHTVSIVSVDVGCSSQSAG